MLRAEHAFLGSTLLDVLRDMNFVSPPDDILIDSRKGPPALPKNVVSPAMLKVPPHV